MGRLLSMDAAITRRKAEKEHQNRRFPLLRLTKAELNALPEYSCSLPTGTTIGKRWKRNTNAYGKRGNEPEWWVLEYYDLGIEEKVGIRYYRVEIKP